MRLKEICFMGMALLFFSLSSFAQENDHFYNVDQEVSIEGKIQQIVMEPRYKDKSPFLIVTLEEKETKNLYTIEISPAGFFDQDFHQGEHLTVTGSLASSGESVRNATNPSSPSFPGITLHLSLCRMSTILSSVPMMPQNCWPASGDS